MMVLEHIEAYRIIARCLPLKYRLNVLVKRYLYAQAPVSIPFGKGTSIVIQPTLSNMRTVSDLIFEGERYLPEYALVKRILEELPDGFTYVDAGANIGTTLWMFAGKAGSIHVIEPMPHLMRIIEQSVNSNHRQGIQLHRVAIGDRQGVVQMADNDNSSVLPQGKNGVEIELTTLDHLLEREERIDLIKIDVEGFEGQVLRGGSQVIRKHRPRLLVEIHPTYLQQYGDGVVQVLDQLRDLGYEMEYYSFLYRLRWEGLGSC